jgi:hypothetical protein
MENSFRNRWEKREKTAETHKDKGNQRRRAIYPLKIWESILNQDYISNILKKLLERA